MYFLQLGHTALPLLLSLIVGTAQLSYAQNQRLVGRQITINNLQQYPAAVFFAEIRDAESGALRDVFVFPISGRQITQYHPLAYITFHWVRRSDVASLCRGRRSAEDCLIMQPDTFFDGPMPRRFPVVEESTALFVPAASPVRIIRTEYAVTVNRGDPPGLSLYPERRVIAFRDGRPMRIETYRKPVLNGGPGYPP